MSRGKTNIFQKFPIGGRWSIVLEMKLGNQLWIIVPALCFFPFGAEDPDFADLTLAWIRFGITLRLDARKT